MLTIKIFRIVHRVPILVRLVSLHDAFSNDLIGADVHFSCKGIRQHLVIIHSCLFAGSSAWGVLFAHKFYRGLTVVPRPLGALLGFTINL